MFSCVIVCEPLQHRCYHSPEACLQLRMHRNLLAAGLRASQTLSWLKGVKFGGNEGGTGRKGKEDGHHNF